MEIKKFVKGKNVLMIPIFSMRSYETGLYNLAADGNMARILSFLLDADFRSATVLIPENSIGIMEVRALLNRRHIDNVFFYATDAYGKNAKQTRDEIDKFASLLTNEAMLKVYDIVISEPNYLTYYLAYRYPKKVIYWNVASVTDKGTPWFVKEYETIDRKIVKLVPTACATISQVKELGYNTFVGEFYNPALFDFKVVYFPFRLTDENYKAKEFAAFIKNLYDNGVRNFKVLYTDVNDSCIFESKDPFVKVSSDKVSYISVLKGKPIIPYFDDSEVLMHISYKEFEYYGCKIVRNFSDLERMILSDE